MKSMQQKEESLPCMAGRNAGENNLPAECRDLVQVLAEKTDELYRECRDDHKKAPQVRAMSSILASLADRVDRLDRDGSSRPREIHEDCRGFTYRAVRSCDLNRICDK